MIENSLFNVPMNCTYPPFKNGLYLEEYFKKKINEGQNINNLKRKYIPATWTNFQLESWFESKKQEMQNSLDRWIQNNPSENGYFTIVQQDDGILLNLPDNTIIYGACCGNIPIPLIYEDKNKTLESYPKKIFNEKQILCSFIGNITSNSVTPNVRQVMFTSFSKQPNFKLIDSGGWNSTVGKNLQDMFISTTLNSKFALAPRGYGRSSFRFFECFQLGTIPIYIWNDKNWLPFQNVIDYNKLCISIHVNEIQHLEKRLLDIDEEKYNSMWKYYEEIKHLFELEGMSNQIISEMSQDMHLQNNLIVSTDPKPYSTFNAQSPSPRPSPSPSPRLAKSQTPVRKPSPIETPQPPSVHPSRKPPPPVEDPSRRHTRPTITIETTPINHTPNKNHQRIQDSKRRR